jgi:hypothetical protein
LSRFLTLEYNYSAVTKLRMFLKEAEEKQVPSAVTVRSGKTGVKMVILYARVRLEGLPSLASASFHNSRLHLSCIDQQEKYNTFNMTSTVSTTVKIVVSMVVVAALVATTFNSTVRTIDRGLAIVLGLHRQTDYSYETSHAPLSFTFQYVVALTSTTLFFITGLH